MNKSTDTPASAPGIALQTLLRNAKGAALRELIGPSVMDTLRGLEPSLASGESLGDLAAGLIDPFVALRNASMRERIIRMLPLPKARELGQRLDAKDGRTLYDDLCSKAADKAALEVLFSFFGVVRDPHAPADTSSDAVKAPAAYALFDHQRAAASRVVDALSNSPHKTVLHMPTGSGKTRTAMHIVAAHLRRHEPTVICWLAQNAELLDQAADEFENSWRHLGDRETGLVFCHIKILG